MYYGLLSGDGWRKWARVHRWCKSTARVEVHCLACGTPAWFTLSEGQWETCPACHGYWTLS